jgi:asparagine synthase (glutamine-hydrolysing)
MDQPSCDAINTYFVSQSAKKGATVSLSGVGADELFAGYSTFKFASILDRIRPVRRHHAASMSLLSMAFSASPHAWQRDWRVRVIAGVLGAFPSSLNRYDLIKQIYTGSEVNRLCNRQDFNKLDLLGEWFDPKLSEIQKVTLAELNTYMVNTLLRDSDVMGMAHSLEIRCPFVDHKVIEFGLNLPDTYKIKGLTTKRILKDAFSNMLPSEILRRKKMGFAFPLSIWLKKRNLRDLVEDCLSESAVRRRGLFRFHEIQKVKRSYYDLRDTSIRTYQTYQKVWELVVLELWMRRYLDRGRE